jgi:radical SAM-linked protein
MQANYVMRMRFVFRKEGAARYIGHLDLARTLERALLRAKIPIAYTQGFNPRPRMQFASALALGSTSGGEIADVLLREQMEPTLFCEQLMVRMAPGIVILRAEAVDPASPSLQALARTALYVATPLDPQDEPALAARVAAFNAAPAIMRERKGKTYDLRPLVDTLELRQSADGAPQLVMRLGLEPGRNGRPDEVLLELGFDPLDVHIHRAELTLAEA